MNLPDNIEQQKNIRQFLAKKQVAMQYTRAVRNYRDQQFNKKAAEQSRQRKLDQRRKRDTLE